MSKTLSLSLLAAGHTKQEAALRDLLNHDQLRHIWVCSRRAGKTYAVAIALLLFALAKPRRNCVYVGLTKDHARNVILEEIFLPIIEQHGIAHVPNKTRQSVTFPNGSVVSFGGSDDLRHVRTLLGNRLSFVAIDEGQDQDPAVLKRLVTKILPPALSDEFGRMLVCGVWPDSPVGFYYELFKSGRWVTHSWAQLDNPHLRDPAQAMVDYLAETGLTDQDPQFQRDWKGIPIWDANATAWSYDKAKNSYTAPVPAWAQPDRATGGRLVVAKPNARLDCFSLAVDPGARDRFAIQVLGWASDRPTDLWHVAEWTSKRQANTSWDVGSEVIDLLAQHLPIAYYFYDAGGSTNELSLFSRVSGRYLLKAANKADLRGQVRHLSTLLRAGRFHVISGSELEQDLERSDWDQAKLALGKYEWSSNYHPDPADAARYAAQAFFAVQVPATVKAREVIDEEQIQRLMQEQDRSEQDQLGHGFMPGDTYDPFGQTL